MARSRFNYNEDITWRGQTKSLVEWAKELKMTYSTLRRRIHDKGWTVEKAFTAPVGRPRKKGSNEL